LQLHQLFETLPLAARCFKASRRFIGSSAPRSERAGSFGCLSPGSGREQHVSNIIFAQQGVQADLAEKLAKRLNLGVGPKTKLSENGRNLMDLGSSMELTSFTIQGFISWVLLLAVLSKVVSTVYGLSLKRTAKPHFMVPSLIWWVSKISALALCASALLLCRLAGDTLGETFFSFILVVASALVAGLAVRRRKLTKAKKAAQPGVQADLA